LNPGPHLIKSLEKGFALGPLKKEDHPREEVGDSGGIGGRILVEAKGFEPFIFL
jgi:hypothetical protein